MFITYFENIGQILFRLTAPFKVKILIWVSSSATTPAVYGPGFSPHSEERRLPSVSIAVRIDNWHYNPIDMLQHIFHRSVKIVFGKHLLKYIRLAIWWHKVVTMQMWFKIFAKKQWIVVKCLRRNLFLLNIFYSKRNFRRWEIQQNNSYKYFGKSPWKYQKWRFGHLNFIYNFKNFKTVSHRHVYGNFPKCSGKL